MTELTFLINLLLEHKLPKVTRDAVAARLKDVEAALSNGARAPIVAPPKPALQIPPHLAGQSASTIAAMMRHEAGSIVDPPPQVNLPPAQIAETPPAPVTHIAQTPAAAAALAHREAIMAQAATGKPMPGQKSPRKF